MHPIFVVRRVSGRKAQRQREIAEAHPWAVLNILKAFNAANDMANAQRLAALQRLTPGSTFYLYRKP